jgi:hypothetical protein
VTLDEALSDLGIPHDAGMAEARRAYLRLLKVRKPETDPQGFMRLREAYELVKAHVETRDAIFRAMGVHLSPPAARREVPVQQELPTPVAAEEPAPSAPEVMEAAPSDQEEAAPRGAEDPMRESGPPPPPEPDPEEEEEEIEDTLAGDAEIEALCDAGRYTEASAELVRVFDAAVEHVDGPTPPVLRAIDVLVALHARNQIRAAEALHGSLSAWLRASGQEARILRGDAAARWSLLQELASLPPRFPTAVRTAIGRALAAGDLGLARRDDDLRRFRLRDAREARTVANMLRTRQPLLAAALADAIDPPQESPAAPAKQGSFRGGWLIAALVMGVLRVVLLAEKSSTSTPSFREGSLYPPPITLPTYRVHDGGLFIPFDASALYPPSSPRPGKSRPLEGGSADAGRCGGTDQP